MDLCGGSLLAQHQSDIFPHAGCPYQYLMTSGSANAGNRCSASSSWAGRRVKRAVLILTLPLSSCSTSISMVRRLQATGSREPSCCCSTFATIPVFDLFKVCMVVAGLALQPERNYSWRCHESQYGCLLYLVHSLSSSDIPQLLCVRPEELLG